jgi:hypothetical protein
MGDLSTRMRSRRDAAPYSAAPPADNVVVMI